MTNVRPKPGDPAELETLAALAYREHRAGRLDEAAAVYCSILALQPDSAEVYNNLGIIRWDQGKLDEAVRRYEQALALRPAYAECTTIWASR